MEGVTFFLLMKPKHDIAKVVACACGWQNFSHEIFKKHTYIFSKHLVEEAGPSAERPDPIPATFTPGPPFWPETPVGDTLSNHHVNTHYLSQKK